MTCARWANRNFLVGCILSFLTGVGMFATIFLTPLFLGYVRGYSAWQIGVAIASTGAASLIGIPIYIALAKRFDTRWLMMFGLAMFALSMWSFSGITHDWGGGTFSAAISARISAGVRHRARRDARPRQPAAGTARNTPADCST